MSVISVDIKGLVSASIRRRTLIGGIEDAEMQETTFKGAVGTLAIENGCLSFKARWLDEIAFYIEVQIKDIELLALQYIKKNLVFRVRVKNNLDDFLIIKAEKGTQSNKITELIQKFWEIAPQYKQVAQAAVPAAAMGYPGRQPTRIIRGESRAASTPSREQAPPKKKPRPAMKSKPVTTTSVKSKEKSKDKSTEPAIELDDAINMIVERYNQEKVRSKFSNWENTLMISFPDIDRSVLYKINGSEGIELNDGVDEDAAVQVTMNSDMFIKMLSKQINAIKAYSSGALKVDGDMKNLLKLRKLMF
ncbi:MAG: SCP2 sterol-binding domain-containing protein [Candidatus Hodarchaeota archaeon]